MFSFQMVINEIYLLTFQRIRSMKRSSIYIRHRQKVNIQSEPYYKVGAMKILLKPRISEESGFFVSW